MYDLACLSRYLGNCLVSTSYNVAQVYKPNRRYAAIDTMTKRNIIINLAQHVVPYLSKLSELSQQVVVVLVIDIGKRRIEPHLDICIVRKTLAI